MKQLESSQRSQIQIEIKNLDEDVAAVEKILLAAVLKFNLYDNTHTSRVLNTVRSIVEGKGFGFGLGARMVEDSIFVDFNRMKTTSVRFEAVHDFILDELKSAFQVELKEIWEGDPAYCKTS